MFDVRCSVRILVLLGLLSLNPLHAQSSSSTNSEAEAIRTEMQQMRQDYERRMQQLEQRLQQFEATASTNPPPPAATVASTNLEPALAERYQAFANLRDQIPLAPDRDQYLRIPLGLAMALAFGLEDVVGDLIDLGAGALQNVGAAIDNGVEQFHQHHFA